MADRDPAIATDRTRPRPAVGTPLAVAVALLATLAGLLSLAWTVLYISKGRFLRPTFERLAGSALQRDVRVRGDFQFYFDPIDLHFLADGFSVSNPAYASRPNLFEARHVEAELPLWTMFIGRRRFHWLDLRDGRVDLEWARDHSTNSWTFGTPDPRHRGKPFELPVIDRASVTGTTVRYRDVRFPLSADLRLDAIRSSGARIGGDVGFAGKGVVRSTPFTATGALLSPNATVGRGKNELRLAADAAGNHLTVHGTLPGLADFENVPLSVTAAGRNMAALFDIIGVVLPQTRRYHLAATMTKSGERYTFAGLTGRFGASDLAGRIVVENREPRLHLQAAMTTRRLDIIDAAPFIGYNPDIVATQGVAAASGQSQATPHLLPDTALPVEKLGNFDADATWHVGVVRSRRVPLEDIDLTLKLFDRKLTMDPLDFTMARGHVASTWTIDARARPAHWTSDIRLAPTPMGRLLAGWGVEEAGTSGVVKGRITLAGDGDSFARWLATSHGRIAFVLPAGTFWTRNVQLAELDVGVFVQKMFEHQLKEPVRINCGLVAFSVRNGIGAADPILIDTQKNVMLGRGGFSFKNEAMDFAFRADAKKFSLFAGQSPIGIHGFFAKPGIQVVSPELVGRAGAALGLALVAAPPAALLAFVDPGDAKAAACGPVLAGATAVQQRTTKGKPRDDVGHGTTATDEDGRASRAERHQQRKKFLGIF